MFIAELFVHGEPAEVSASTLDPLLCIELEAVPTVSAYLMAKPKCMNRAARDHHGGQSIEHDASQEWTKWHDILAHVPETNNAQTSSHGTDQSTNEKARQRGLAKHSVHTFLEASPRAPMAIEQHISAEK